MVNTETARSEPSGSTHCYVVILLGLIRAGDKTHIVDNGFISICCQESCQMRKTKAKDRIIRPDTLDRSGMRSPITLKECAIFQAWGFAGSFRDSVRWGRTAIYCYALHLGFLTMHYVNWVLPFLQASGLEEWRRRREKVFQIKRSLADSACSDDE